MSVSATAGKSPIQIPWQSSEFIYERNLKLFIRKGYYACNLCRLSLVPAHVKLPSAITYRRINLQHSLHQRQHWNRAVAHVIVLSNVIVTVGGKKGCCGSSHWCLVNRNQSLGRSVRLREHHSSNFNFLWGDHNCIDFIDQACGSCEWRHSFNLYHSTCCRPAIITWTSHERHNVPIAGSFIIRSTAQQANNKETSHHKGDSNAERVSMPSRLPIVPVCLSSHQMVISTTNNKGIEKQ